MGCRNMNNPLLMLKPSSITSANEQEQKLHMLLIYQEVKYAIFIFLL